ncbi:DUF2252 family protein [Endozoicomonas sp. G2_1]|uniref:DUF2252 family protein n=1 Tax=Endozoicomonas sp. G2_1 TaxID=2821091 RepID=UPI001ADBFB41|nr:DUF2252 family protein [Endozoicomonas sp. G2_1]MBO9491075.1 DUF2252 family protein [Endozoicomonas sp. G2_1]
MKETATNTQRRQQLEQYFISTDGHKPQQQIAKHLKMATSPFLFFRGSAPLFYRDIADNLLNIPEQLAQMPLTTIMGDCHSSNFGFFTEEGSHGDSVIFAVNDFDDACIGQASWELARFITSLFLAQHHCHGIVTDRYASEKDYQNKPVINQQHVIDASRAFIDSYINSCQRSIEDVNYRSHALNSFADHHILAKRYQKAVNRAANNEGFSTESTLAKAVDLTAAPLRFKVLPERFAPLAPKEYQAIEQAFAPYVDDCILDIVGRLNAGTGSVNMGRYYLLVGPKNADKNQLALCHVVEIKQQRAAAPLATFADLSPVNQLNPAHLTVNCQRRMQRSPDLVLDEVEWRGQHWLVRSRHHAKVGIKPEQIAIGKKAVNKGGFVQYAQACGHALALSHCRGDRRSTLFEQAIVETLPNVATVLIDACQQYLEQVLTDTELLQQMLTDD